MHRIHARPWTYVGRISQFHSGRSKLPWSATTTGRLPSPLGGTTSAARKPLTGNGTERADPDTGASNASASTKIPIPIGTRQVSQR